MTNPFTPEGRMTRRFYLLVIIAVDALGLAINFGLSGSMPVDAVVGFVIMSALLWPVYCSMSKRLHDADKTSIPAIIALSLCIGGSFFLHTGATLMPDQMHVAETIATTMILGAAVFALYILLAKPTKGPNRYGEDPREPAFVETPIDGPPPAAYDGV